MRGRCSSIQTSDLISRFKDETDNSMVAETMEEYALASAEAAYENPGKQAPMVFMESSGEIKGS